MKIKNIIQTLALVLACAHGHEQSARAETSGKDRTPVTCSRELATSDSLLGEPAEDLTRFSELKFYDTNCDNKISPGDRVRQVQYFSEKPGEKACLISAEVGNDLNLKVKGSECYAQSSTNTWCDRDSTSLVRLPENISPNNPGSLCDLMSRATFIFVSACYKPIAHVPIYPEFKKKLSRYDEYRRRALDYVTGYHSPVLVDYNCDGRADAGDLIKQVFYKKTIYDYPAEEDYEGNHQVCLVNAKIHDSDYFPIGNPICLYLPAETTVTLAETKCPIEWTRDTRNLVSREHALCAALLATPKTWVDEQFYEDY